jgi:hypothetical protein
VGKIEFGFVVGSRLSSRAIMKLSIPLIGTFTMLVLTSPAILCFADNQPSDLVIVETDSTVPLSVPPLDHVDYPPDRPNWIEEHQQPTGGVDGSDLLISVSSGPAATPEIATEMMEVMARGAVENFLHQQAETLPEAIPVEQIEVDMDWVRRELISRRYDGALSGSESTRYESACLLRIDSVDQQTLHQMIQNLRLQHRLGLVGVVAIICLLGLLSGSIMFGWLAGRQKHE